MQQSKAKAHPTMRGVRANVRSRQSLLFMCMLFGGLALLAVWHHSYAFGEVSRVIKTSDPGEVKLTGAVVKATAVAVPRLWLNQSDPPYILNLTNIPSEHAASHAAIRAYVRSPEYEARVREILAANITGIVIPAGGPRLTASLLVTLHALRHDYGCGLPVEVMWQNDVEMDNATWAQIMREFGPIRGINLQHAQHPVPGLHTKFTPKRFVGKVYSLVVSEFRHVLMLDADAHLLQPPAALFESPQYVSNGNTFWPDVWARGLTSKDMSLHGLDKSAVIVIKSGKGYAPRDSESGQLLIDRARHLDVIEYLLWINLGPGSKVGWPQSNLYGDKDTFGLAFAMAGKAHLFRQVPVPPGENAGSPSPKTQKPQYTLHLPQHLPLRPLNHSKPLS